MTAKGGKARGKARPGGRAGERPQTGPQARPQTRPQARPQTPSSRRAETPPASQPGAPRVPARVRDSLRDPIVAALAASLLLAVAELVALGGPPLRLAAVVVALHAGLGLAIGAVLAAIEALLRRRPRLRRAASWLYALGCVPALVFVSQDLFEGAQAATLPGARLGHVWLPIAGFVAVAATVAVARQVLRRLGAGIGAGVVAMAGAGMLAGGALLVEAANRTLYTSEYADVHAFLIVVSCVLATLAVRVAASARISGPASDHASAQEAGEPHAAHAHGPWRPGPRLWLAACVAVALSLVWALPRGMADKDDRKRVATHGTHARHLARVVRLAFDADRDGAATVLGGGDCDDGQTAVHPAAVEVPDNGVDEDCDGRDLALPRRSVHEPDWRARLAAWQASPAVAETLSRARDMNVLVIAIDALRADALAPGRQAEDAPHLTALLSESVRFERAFATGAGTDLSVSSTMTGRIDPFVTVETTLAEAMRRGGRATGAVYPTEVLRYAGEVLLARGMDQVTRYVNDRGQRDVGSYTTSAQTTERALATLDALRRSERPFFLWAHYFDVHEHHEVEVTDRELVRHAGGRDLRTAAGKYRALVALTDHEIGRLVEAVRERDLWDRTIVVLFSDHGESLGEDPRLPRNHGRFVYNALTHVPLAIRIPGVPPRRVDTPVSVIDLMPTLLALGSMEAPAGLDGASLLPLFLGDAPGRPAQPIALNESEQWGVIVWPYKLLVRPADNLVELYDLAADFGETRDLAEEMPERVTELRSVQAGLPQVELDRTRQGRRARDARARPPQRPKQGG
jgi:arylsulfatase A-like enzyme